MEEEPKSARAEFMMAIAGPLASLFLSACFYLLVSLGVRLGDTTGVAWGFVLSGVF